MLQNFNNGITHTMGSAGLGDKIGAEMKLDNPWVQRSLTDIGTAALSGVVRGRFDIEGLATQLIADNVGVTMQQAKAKSISEDESYHQSQQASRGNGVANDLDEQWQSEFINEAKFAANTPLPSITFDVDDPWTADQLGQRVSEEVSRFQHVDLPRNPNGFWRGVDDVLKLREGTIAAVSSVFSGNYAVPQDNWEAAGYAIGAPLAMGAQIITAEAALGAEAIEGVYQGSQRVVGRVSSQLEKWGLFGSKQLAAEKAVNDLAIRRAYLNAKFGRVGDLDTDITLRGYLNQAESLDVSTSPNTAVFYSGDFGANRIKAEEFSRLFNKTTLEMTPGGGYLDNQHISLILPEKLSIKPWQKLSERYAQSASGETYVFVRGAGAEGIFNTIELPALLKNPNVTNIFERETPYLYEAARINYAP
jgi:hypothetical protein